jgi:hypothetical protein
MLSSSTSPILASERRFSVPEDLALRIRLGDTLTSTDSQVGDPFSATVVDEGTYQNARAYGHIPQIDMSGKIEGHTTMMPEFDRLVMPDGRRAPIRPRSSSFTTLPPARRSMLKALSNQAGEPARLSSTPRSALERQHCWAESSAAAKGRASDPRCAV